MYSLVDIGFLSPMLCHARPSRSESLHNPATYLVSGPVLNSFARPLIAGSLSVAFVNFRFPYDHNRVFQFERSNSGWFCLAKSLKSQQYRSFSLQPSSPKTPLEHSKKICLSL